jgi:hypothetical protein
MRWLTRLCDGGGFVTHCMSIRVIGGQPRCARDRDSRIRGARHHQSFG